MQISDKAIAAIKDSNRLIGRLMIAFNRGQNTIENWMASKDVRLTAPIATEIIAEESKMPMSEILEEIKEVVK